MPDVKCLVRLRIAPEPARAVGTAVEILSRWIDPAHLRLGGGTALEARWHHRGSTDLDFFVHSDHADAVFYERADQMVQDLVELAEQGMVAPVGIRMTERRVIHFRIDATPVSMGRTEVLHGDPSGEAETTTGVQLAATEDVLTKKLRDRLGGNQIVTERDAYDFIVARTKTPDALMVAWRATPEDRRLNALDMYRSLTDGHTSAALTSQQLIDPAYPNVADHLWEYAADMFASGLEHIPPLGERRKAYPHGR